MKIIEQSVKKKSFHISDPQKDKEMALYDKKL